MSSEESARNFMINIAKGFFTLVIFCLAVWLCVGWLSSCVSVTSITPKVTTVTIYGLGYERRVQAVALDSVLIDSVRVK